MYELRSLHNAHYHNKTVSKSYLILLKQNPLLTYTLTKLNLTRDFSQYTSYPHQQCTKTCNYSQLAHVIMIVISSSTNMHLAVHIDVSNHSTKLI